MAATHGMTGALYWMPTMTDTSIAFVDGGGGADSITDSNSGFVTAGFKDDDLITVSGSTSNNNTFDVTTVAAGTLTLPTGKITAEIAGDTVTIIHALPGQILAQFYGCELTMNDRVVDVTAFEDAGVSQFISGVTEWSMTAEAFWSDSDNQNAWLGAAAKTLRLFMRYDAAPDVTNAWYWEGTVLTMSQGVLVPSDSAITRTVGFQGTGARTRVTRSTAWPTAT